MKRIVAAIGFILIFITVLSASVIPAGAESVAQTLYKAADIKIDGKNDDNGWRGYEVSYPFGQPGMNDEKINSGNDVTLLTVQVARVDKNTVKFNISAMLKPGSDSNRIGVKIAVEGSEYATVTVGDMIETASKNTVIADDDYIKMIAAVSYHKESSQMICEIEAVLKSSEFGERIESDFRVIDGNGSESAKGEVSPPSLTTTTKKPTTEKTTKEKTTKEKNTTAKPATTVTTEISHRTRRTTTAKSTAEITNEKAAKLKTTKQKTAKQKTTKAKKTTSKAEKTLSERYYSSQAAEITTIVTSAETQTEPTSAAVAASETDKSLFGGEKLSKSSLYKLITGAVALVLFAIIGVSAVRTKSAADKAEEKPFSEKQKEEEQEDKKE